MSNRNHSYDNTDLNTEQSAGYTLLVQIGLNSFSYAVAGQDRLLVLKENLSLIELSQISESNNLLLSDYKKRIVSLPHNGFTFVPVSLFKPEKVADFARFLDVKPDEKVFSQPLDADNQVIYKADESLVNLVTEKFGINSITFAPRGWIIITAANNPSNKQLYINIDGDKVEFLNFRDGKLRFYNSFEFKAADELAYFAMFVTGELQLQPQDITLILSGDVALEDGNATGLARFFGKIELNSMSSLELPDQTNPHDILTLTALSLCGSSEAV
jgi:hypothetical protein